MAEFLLTSRSQLDGHLPPGRHGGTEGEPGVTIAERRDLALFVILARKGRARVLIERGHAFGLPLPAGPGRAEGRGVAVVWTGPGQWLCVCAATDRERAERLFAPVAEVCHLVALDDARAILTLSGRHVRDMLAKMLALDLNPRAFRAGDAAVTVAGDIAVTLWQLDDAPTFEAAVPRSFARSFAHQLMEAAAEYGCMIGGEAV